MTVADIGEDGVIKLLRDTIVAGDSELSPAALGWLDDVAKLDFDTLRGGEEELVLSVDSSVENVHFRRDWMSGEDIGWRTLAVSLSDLAAKGAVPIGCLLSWSLPGDTAAEWVKDFAQGFAQVALKCDCPLLGGDTTASPRGIFASVTVIGKIPKGQLRARTSGKVGDVIVVTGPLGDSSAGLEILQDRKEKEDLPQAFFKRKSLPWKEFLLQRHRRPLPRIDEGIFLREQAGVHAMMDLSDGLAVDIARMSQASKVEIEILCDQISVSEQLVAYSQGVGEATAKYTVFGGEDYELLATVDQKDVKGIAERYQQKFGRSLNVVGVVASQRHEGSAAGVRWISEADLSRYSSFRHW